MNAFLIIVIVIVIVYSYKILFFLKLLLKEYHDIGSVCSIYSPAAHEQTAVYSVAVEEINGNPGKWVACVCNELGLNVYFNIISYNIIFVTYFNN